LNGRLLVTSVAAFIAPAEDLKQQLGPGLGKRHEAQLVDEQLETESSFWKRIRRRSSLASISSCARDAAVVNRTRKPF